MSFVAEPGTPSGQDVLFAGAPDPFRVVPISPWQHLPANSRLVSQRIQGTTPSTRGAVFLDRDGVIVEDVHFPRTLDQLRILPGVVQALRALQERFYLIVVTNQSGVARGLLTEEDLLAIHSELVHRLAAQDVAVDTFYYCPHLPEAPVEGYSLDCDCRKPKPGMLLRARRDWDIDMACSFMVGDKPRDIEAGCAAGVRSILLGGGGAVPAGAHGLAPDLAQAAQMILRSPDPMQRGAVWHP